MTVHDEAAAFAPFEALAAHLLPALPISGDGSHDIAHLRRVWTNMRAIQSEEGGAPDILAAACLLHDCVAVEKNSGLRSRASRLAASRAGTILSASGWSPAAVEQVRHAIEAHSFSAGIAPRSIEAEILQDADRLDAIGALGVARCFYTAGRMGSLLYDPADPRGERRERDDARFAMDHFHAKLLHLAAGFRTGAGRRMAQARHERMVGFLAGMEDEIGLPALRHSDDR